MLAKKMLVVSGGLRAIDIPQSEMNALIAFYHATDGDNWTDNTGWLTDPMVGNWFGVTVSGGHVTEIDLHANNLVGSIADFAIDDLSALVDFRIYSTSVSGDISGWVLPATLVTFRINSTSVSGDISGWVLPATLVSFYVYSTSVSGDISGWVLPATLVSFYVFSTSVSGVPVMTSAVAISNYQYQGCGLAQACVDGVGKSIYDDWARLNCATPSLSIGGTNATPSGVYQDATPPTTGLEYIYKLANDPDATGNNTWPIAWNGGSAP